MKKPVLIYVALMVLIVACMFTSATAQENPINNKIISLNDLLDEKEINSLNAFEGIWTTEDSRFITVFTHNSYNDTLQVYTFSFTHNGLVKEKIIDIKDGIVKTHVTNLTNGWDVIVEWKVINDNTLIGNFEGDAAGPSIFYRANLQINHPVNF